MGKSQADTVHKNEELLLTKLDDFFEAFLAMLKTVICRKK
jgi:hypothetical protein